MHGLGSLHAADVAIDAAVDGDFPALAMYEAATLALAVAEYVAASLYNMFAVRYACNALAESKNKRLKVSSEAANLTAEATLPCLPQVARLF